MKIYNYPKLFVLLIRLWKRIKELKKMKNPQTTIAGIVTALGGILSIFGIVVPSEIQSQMVALGVAVMGVGTFFVGLFAKDAKEKKPE